MSYCLSNNAMRMIPTEGKKILCRQLAYRKEKLTLKTHDIITA